MSTDYDTVAKSFRRALFSLNGLNKQVIT